MAYWWLARPGTSLTCEGVTRVVPCVVKRLCWVWLSVARPEVAHARGGSTQAGRWLWSVWVCGAGSSGSVVILRRWWGDR